jgi:hypothetical protein
LSIALNPKRAFEERRLGEIFTCGVKRIRPNALKKKIETHGATIEISAVGRSRRDERLKVPSDAGAKLLVKALRRDRIHSRRKVRRMYERCQCI